MYVCSNFRNQAHGSTNNIHLGLCVGHMGNTPGGILLLSNSLFKPPTFTMQLSAVCLLCSKRLHQVVIVKTQLTCPSLAIFIFFCMAGLFSDNWILSLLDVTGVYPIEVQPTMLRVQCIAILYQNQIAQLRNRICKVLSQMDFNELLLYSFKTIQFYIRRMMPIQKDIVLNSSYHGTQSCTQS